MLTRLRLENFKSWEDTGDIKLKPITGFFGPNSSGKSSLFQALLMMKQTADSGDPGAVFHFGNEKTLVDLGDFESVVYRHDTKRALKLSVEWNAKREFTIPDKYARGTVDEGDVIGFDVELREGETIVGTRLVVEEMFYQIGDGWRLGMRLAPNGMMYELFAYGSDFDVARQDFGGGDRVRLSKFHRFPEWSYEDSGEHDLFFQLYSGLELLLSDLRYLGPLRSHPKRIYAWSGAETLDLGPSGDFTIDAILSYQQRYEEEASRLNIPFFSIGEYIAGWLKHLGLVHDFRIEAVTEGRRIYEVKARKTPNSPEVLLGDVGFGVSQILPVLTLCFYAPEGSILILEQPDIHLHPSVQAGLADVFIDAWKKRKVQILFESHSEHLLRRLQRRIAEEEIPEDDVGLFFCSTDDSGASNLSQLEVDEFGNIANWPKDFFGDQFGEIAAMSEAALKRQVASE